MRWRWIILITALVLLVAAPVVGVYRLLNSEAGLEFALEQLQRLESILSEHRRASAEEIISQVETAVLTHSVDTTPLDDITLLLVRRQ